MAMVIGPMARGALRAGVRAENLPALGNAGPEVTLTCASGPTRMASGDRLAAGGKFPSDWNWRDGCRGTACGRLSFEMKTEMAYFCHRQAYPSIDGGLGGFGGSFGFGGLILDGRILGDIGLRSDLGVRFQGIWAPPRLTGISEENGECPARV